MNLTGNVELTEKHLGLDSVLRNRALQALSDKYHISMETLNDFEKELRKSNTLINLNKYKRSTLLDALEIIHDYPNITQVPERFEYPLNMFSREQLLTFSQMGHDGILSEIDNIDRELNTILKKHKELEDKYGISQEDLHIIRTAGKTVYKEHTNFSVSI